MNQNEHYDRILELRWYDYARRIDRRICKICPYNSEAHKAAEIRLLYGDVFGQYEDSADRFRDPIRDAG